MDHTVNDPVTFTSKDASALQINIYENPWVKTHTGFHLNTDLFRNLKDISSSHHIFQNAEKKNSFISSIQT